MRNACWFTMATLSDGIDSQMMLRIILESKMTSVVLTRSQLFLFNVWPQNVHTKCKKKQTKTETDSQKRVWLLTEMLSTKNTKVVESAGLRPEKGYSQFIRGNFGANHSHSIVSVQRLRTILTWLFGTGQNTISAGSKDLFV